MTLFPTGFYHVVFWLNEGHTFDGSDMIYRELLIAVDLQEQRRRT